MIWIVILYVLLFIALICVSIYVITKKIECQIPLNSCDNCYSKLNDCNTTLNGKITDYYKCSSDLNNKTTEYDKCSNDLNNKTTEYDKCSSDLNNKKTDISRIADMLNKKIADYDNCSVDLTDKNVQLVKCGKDLSDETAKYSKCNDYLMKNSLAYIYCTDRIHYLTTPNTDTYINVSSVNKNLFRFIYLGNHTYNIYINEFSGGNSTEFYHPILYGEMIPSSYGVGFYLVRSQYTDSTNAIKFSINPVDTGGFTFDAISPINSSKTLRMNVLGGDLCKMELVYVCMMICEPSQMRYFSCQLILYKIFSVCNIN